MIHGIHHVSITTKNLERLSRFYREQIGFERAVETAWSGDNPAADAIFALPRSAVRMEMLRKGGSFLELFEFVHPTGRPLDPTYRVCDQGITHLCLQVTDIQAEYDRLSRAGMIFNCPPQHAVGLCWATYGRDPDGNIVELVEPDPAGPFAV